MTLEPNQQSGASQEARERLLDILLEEEATAIEAGQPYAEKIVTGTVNSNAPRRSRRSSLLIMAAALLGIATVTATAWLQREEVGLRHEAYGEAEWPAQDPVKTNSADKELVKVRDLEHFRTLLTKATGIRLTHDEIRGAARAGKNHSSADQLVTRTWGEHFVITRADHAADFSEWLTAVRESLSTQEKQNSIRDALNFHLELPNARHVRMLVSANGNPSWFSTGTLKAFVASKALAKLLTDANSDIIERHQIERGVVESLDDLDHLPADATRVETRIPNDTTAAVLGKLRQLPKLQSLRLLGELPAAAISALGDFQLAELELKGVTLTAAHLEAIAKLTSLRTLVFEGCTGLAPGDGAELRQLSGLSQLRRLHCIDTSVGESGESLTGLLALPNLEDFGLRQKGLELTKETLAPLTRTKLRRLLLVDTATTGEDLASLRGMPMLSELILVGSLTDSDLETLTDLEHIKTLRLRNNQISFPAGEEFRVARPDVELDWKLSARFFDTIFAFDEWQ